MSDTEKTASASAKAPKAESSTSSDPAYDLEETWPKEVKIPQSRATVEWQTGRQENLWFDLMWEPRSASAFFKLRASIQIETPPGISPAKKTSIYLFIYPERVRRLSLENHSETETGHRADSLVLRWELAKQPALILPPYSECEPGNDKSKRTREVDETSRAEYQFQVRVTNAEKSPRKKKKRRTIKDGADSGPDEILDQVCPFIPSGTINSSKTMDVQYVVEPSERWSKMASYNSFVLNGCKYFTDNFIFVANNTSIEGQRSSVQNKQEWVARILEIRASDERHVYARVFWMYRPEELPQVTVNGRQCIQGRQRYHGQDELIASNHMDIIDVLSITHHATVNQVSEDDDDQIQSELYWRQAFDVRTQEISANKAFCHCKQPENPDRVMIKCPNDTCKEWLHEECLKHHILLKVYKVMEADTTYKASGKAAEEREVERHRSPVERGNSAVAPKVSTQVGIDGEGQTLNTDDFVEFNEGCAAGTEEGSVRPQDSRVSRARACRVRRGRKQVFASSTKPYKGRFEASLSEDQNMFKVTDLRAGAGCKKTWMEELNCIICSARIC